jgi:ATP-dependent DNA helicase RecG
LPNKIRDVLGIIVEVNLKSESSNKYIEIIVLQYDVPISFRGKYYIRAGSTLQELKGISLNEFIIKRTGKTWDDIIETKATINDIDVTTVEEYIKDTKKTKRIKIEKDITITKLLEKLYLVDNGFIKRAAIILFGKDPSKFYPNIPVKIGRFGESDSDLKYHEVVEGNLIQIKTKIENILNSKFFIHEIDFNGMQRLEKNEYPIPAIREMILNALVHRIYMGSSTQIRIYNNYFSVWNDGGLPEGLTEADLRIIHRSKPRNPVIADICFKGGYIDAWGRGTINNISKPTATRDINELIKKRLIKNIGSKGSSAVYEKYYGAVGSVGS